MNIINVSAYKFVSLDKDRLPELKLELLEQAKSHDLKGTILISTEGINLFIAGTPENIQSYKAFLSAYKEFDGLPFKDSPSAGKPFTRMLVRIKKEIISMGCEEIKPEQYTSPHLSAEQLKAWYDENKEMVILDTRNTYEVKLGTFENAIDLDIETFRAFPEAVKKLPESMKDKPVVTFCTGGIRCEKAAAYMNGLGFKDVYQLDGGILKYFETCGGDHYDGECFVFDKRVAVDSDLAETTTQQCYACRMPLMPNQQKEDGCCPFCHGNARTGEKMEARAE